MRYDAPSGGHDDTVMSLAIAWQGVTGHVRRAANADFFKSAMDANAALTKSGLYMGEADRTPSEYPEGGAGGNPWSASRWQH
jgi:hypothetical protein